MNLDDVKGVGLFRSDEGKTAWVVGVDEVAATAVDHIPLPGQRPVDDDRAAGGTVDFHQLDGQKAQADRDQEVGSQRDLSPGQQRQGRHRNSGYK